MFIYKNQTKINFIIILIVALLFVFSFNTLFAALTDNILTETGVYFSLYDDPESIIIENIDNAKEFINIAMYTFTDREIAQAIIRAKDRGVDIKIYLDPSQVNAKYSKSRYFVNNGVEGIRISSNDYIMHNKFAVIDDKNIIKKYQNQFNNLWNDKYSPGRYKELISEAGISSLPAPETSGETPTLLGKVININTASLEKLDDLWGIGKIIAQNIIDYRETCGGFKTPEEIKLVDGIDDKKWDKWKFEGWAIKIK